MYSPVQLPHHSFQTFNPLHPLLLPHPYPLRPYEICWYACTIKNRLFFTKNEDFKERSAKNEFFYAFPKAISYT